MNTAAEILEELLERLEALVEIPGAGGSRSHPLIDMIDEDVAEARDRWTRLKLTTGGVR